MPIYIVYSSQVIYDYLPCMQVECIPVSPRTHVHCTVHAYDSLCDRFCTNYIWYTTHAHIHLRACKDVYEFQIIGTCNMIKCCILCVFVKTKTDIHV